VAKKKKVPAVKGPKSKCPKCGSTRRRRLRQTTVQEHGGITPEGLPYTHIVRRWVECAECGQVRVDYIPENHADGGDPNFPGIDK